MSGGGIGIIGTLKTAADVAISLSKLRTMAEVQAKAIELQQVILAAQSDAFAAQSEQRVLLDRISGLEKELTAVKAWETEKQRYELKAVATGAFAYVVKDAMKGAEPSHWICAACYENGRKSILQEERRNGIYCKCPACNATINSSYRAVV